MKKFLLLILICSLSIISPAQQNIKAIGAGEYATGYLTDKNEVYQVLWDSHTPPALSVHKVNVPAAYKIAGNQYTFAVTTLAGDVYDVGGNGSVTKLNVSDVSEAWGFFKNTVVIFRNGTIGIINTSNQLTRFNQPNGKFFKKIVVSSNETFAFAAIFALATDGSLYKYNMNGSSYSAVLLGCTDVAAISHKAVVATTANDIYFLQGYDGRHVGLPYGINYQTSIKQQFKDAAWPYKQMAGNYNTLHIIDANDDMWGIGDNAMGEIGNGEGIRYINDQWSWGNLLKQTPLTKIPGKWKNIQTSIVVTFYLYAQDLKGNWFSWGRNKTRALGNGINLRDYTLNGDLGGSDRPNYLDVWTPTHVQPLSVDWKVVKFDPNKIPQAPIINLPDNDPLPTPSMTVLKSYHDSIVFVLTTQIEDKRVLIEALNSEKQRLIENMILFKEELEKVLKKY